MKMSLSLPRSRRAQWRIAYTLIIVLGIVVAAVATTAHNRQGANAIDTTARTAWQQQTTSLSPPLDTGAVLSRYAIKQASGNAELNWQTGSATDLKASLASLDAAGVRFAQVKVTRSGSGFAVVAERAP